MSSSSSSASCPLCPDYDRICYDYRGILVMQTQCCKLSLEKLDPNSSDFREAQENLAIAQDRLREDSRPLASYKERLQLLRLKVEFILRLTRWMQDLTNNHLPARYWQRIWHDCSDYERSVLFLPAHNSSHGHVLASTSVD
jgi:hypothetical protein